MFFFQLSLCGRTSLSAFFWAVLLHNAQVNSWILLVSDSWRELLKCAFRWMHGCLCLHNMRSERPANLLGGPLFIQFQELVGQSGFNTSWCQNWRPRHLSSLATSSNHDSRNSSKLYHNYWDFPCVQCCAQEPFLLNRGWHSLSENANFNCFGPICSLAVAGWKYLKCLTVRQGAFCVFSALDSLLMLRP